MRRTNISDHLGYNTQTIEHELMAMGGVFKPSARSAPIKMPEIIHETEKAVVVLPNDQRKVVIAHYMWTCTKNTKVKELGLSKTIYHSILDNAHAWLDGYFVHQRKNLQMSGRFGINNPKTGSYALEKCQPAH
ncbi:MAG: hypothetical protein MJA29_00120 [Candidatus Omnitrophica bacterium]|nr:hypothetical protein [Candidatus Omnitrophota bacterium]